MIPSCDHRNRLTLTVMDDIVTNEVNNDGEASPSGDVSEDNESEARYFHGSLTLSLQTSEIYCLMIAAL